MNAMIRVLCLWVMLSTSLAWAGLDEGLAAAKAGDYATALREWRPLAERGDARAQFYLGLMYEKGRGVAQDNQQAVAWYRKAAEQGVAEAQYNLGLMYANGPAAAQNDQQAVHWARKAAEQGVAQAQFNLGLMYANGRGVPQDDQQAVAWYRKAYKNPDATVKIKQRAESELTRLGASPATPAAPKVASPQTPARQPAAPSDTAPPVFAFDQGDRIVLTQPVFTLKGRVQDDSKVAEIHLDGQPISPGKDGTFSVKRFFAVGETVLSFVATDIHGNTATRDVTVVREADKTQAVAATEPVLVPPDQKARTNPHALALIIGIEDYRDAPKAKYAAHDANLFYDYAQRSLGIPAANIKLLTNDQASRSGLLSAIRTWLAPMITPGKSQVTVYFAGHGLASADGDKAWLIPQDGVPGLLEDTAIDRQRLIDEIAKVNPKSVMLFFDTCYSGGARGATAGANASTGAMLVADARPVILKAKAEKLPPNFVQFSAAGNDQLAHSHTSQPHGLFSYYLMRGLSGEADANHDNRLTAGELHDYVRERVQRIAMTHGRPQVPEITGERDKVIAAWTK